MFPIIDLPGCLVQYEVLFSFHKLAAVLGGGTTTRLRCHIHDTKCSVIPGAQNRGKQTPSTI